MKTLLIALVLSMTIAGCGWQSAAPVATPTETAAPTAVPATPTARPTIREQAEAEMLELVRAYCPQDAVSAWALEAQAIMADAAPYLAIMASDPAALFNTGAADAMMDFGDRFMDLRGPECASDISVELASGFYRMALAVVSAESGDFDTGTRHSQAATAHFNEASRLTKLINAGN